MAGSLQGPAAASLDRTPYGAGKSGGKITRPRQHTNSQQDHRPLASSSTALVRKGPYDRPLSGPHASRGLASRIITGASSFLSSFFRRDSTTTAQDNNDVELLASHVPEEPALEDLLKERAFTREQCGRLIKVLQSKMKDTGPLPQANGPLSNGLVEERFPDEELEREQETRGRETEQRVPVPGMTTTDVADPDSSPVDIARAYMGNRLSPIPGAYPVKTLDYGLGRSRDDLPRVATPGHTPYVRLRHSRVYDRPTPYALRANVSREKKRRVDDESEYTVRRTRMKLSNGPPISSLPSASNDFGNGTYLDRMKRLQKKRVERKGEEVFTGSVPLQSSETARRILETLEILTPPKVKSLEEELSLMREKRPTELSPSMLNDQARSTMLTIECPVAEPPVESMNRMDAPSSSETPAPVVAQPAADDLKGKGITTSVEAGAGPSIGTVPSDSQGKKSIGFRMNTMFEECTSDDEGQGSPSPVTPVPWKQPQEFTGFTLESTSSPVLTPSAPSTPPVSLPTVTEDIPKVATKHPEVVAEKEKVDPKPQPLPFLFSAPTPPAPTSPTIFQSSPAFGSDISFAVPSVSAPLVSDSVPSQSPTTASIWQSSTSSSFFSSVTTSAPSASTTGPVVDERKVTVNDATDSMTTSTAISEPSPVSLNGPASGVQEPIKPAFAFGSSEPALATSTSPLAPSDAKPYAKADAQPDTKADATKTDAKPAFTFGGSGAQAAPINSFADMPSTISSSSSPFTTPIGSLTSGSSAGFTFTSSTPTKSLTVSTSSTTTASTTGLTVFANSVGNPFTPFIGGVSSSPSSGGDMDMAEEPAQAPSTPASSPFTASTPITASPLQPFIFSSPSTGAAPAASTFNPSFGQSSPMFTFGTSGSLFGGSSTSPSVFGMGGSSSAPSSAPAFGTSTTSAPAFASSSSFGGASAPAFGTSTAFGGSSTPAFGQSSPAPGFGSASFGASSSAFATGFGSLSAPASGSVFGSSSTPAFGGASSAPAFGTSTSFGSSAAAFGSSPGFGGGAPPAVFTFGSSPTPPYGSASAFSTTPSQPVPFGGAPSAPSFPAFGSQPAVGSQPASFGQFQLGSTDKERRAPFKYRRTGGRKPK